MNDGCVLDLMWIERLVSGVKYVQQSESSHFILPVYLLRSIFIMAPGTYDEFSDFMLYIIERLASLCSHAFEVVYTLQFVG